MGQRWHFFSGSAGDISESEVSVVSDLNGESDIAEGVAISDIDGVDDVSNVEECVIVTV
jgi:hypothetical protein